MTATIARRRRASASYRIVQVTQHWTIERGVFYRDCVVVLPDGTRSLLRIRDDLVPAAVAA